MKPTPIGATAEATPDFFADDSTDTFDIAPGYWVELKRQLDYGELVQLEGTLFKGMTSSDGDGEDTTTWRTDSANFYVLRLALYIVDWNLPGKNKKVIPLPAKTSDRMRAIKPLNPKWAKRIAERIDELQAEQAKTAAAEVDPEGNPTTDSGPATD